MAFWCRLNACYMTYAGYWDSDDGRIRTYVMQCERCGKHRIWTGLRVEADVYRVIPVPHSVKHVDHARLTPPSAAV